jgi:nucleoside phosphorylase
MAIDFLILTPLAEEREAMLSKLPASTRLPPSPEDVRTYYQSTLSVRFSDNSISEYSIIVTDLINMGRVEAAICIGDAVRRWQPRYVLLVGIAGGVSEAGVHLGDVLVADQIADYEVQKLTADGPPSIRWQVHRADPRLFEAAQQLRATDWQPLVSKSRPIEGSPTQHFGPVCSGDKVIANGLADQFRDVWAKLVGVEMEAAGVASALFQTTLKPGFLMIRGVSDLADKDKASPEVESWRAYACDVAAAFTFAFLQSGPIPPHAQQSPPPTTAALKGESPRFDANTLALDEKEGISLAKCVERWQAAGVSKTLAVRFSKDVSIGEPTTQMQPSPAKPLIVLVGEIGSGKTLLAHRLFQGAISRARASSQAPWPVFLEAKEAVGKLRQAIQSEVTSFRSIQESGAFVVIDGADEAGLTAIDQLLSEARTLTAIQRPPMLLVITCRPLGRLHDKAKEEIIEIPPLSQDASINLIREVSGHTFNLGMTSDWPNSLREALRRPLFAILYGIFLQAHYGKTSFSLGELLAHLVDRAIEYTPLNKANVERLLEKLATLSADRNGSHIPIREIGTRLELEPLLESRLIVERGGTLYFPLAILREWFGAQALVSDDTTLSRVLNTPTLLDPWLNSLIIAVATFDHDRVSKLLKPLAEKHPGVASLVVDKALASWGIHEESFAPPSLECGRRIREAMQSWVTGIGKLALLTAPIREDGSVTSIAAKIEGPGLTTSWYEGKDKIDDVVELPASISEQDRIASGWPGLRWARPTRQSAWPWKWTLEELSAHVSKLVDETSFPLVDGPVIDELLWPQLVALSRRRLSLQEQISTPWSAEISVSLIAEELKDPNMRGNWHFTAGWCNIDFVRLQLTHARARGITVFNSPWPEGDQAPRGPMVGSNYSAPRLLLRATVVYTKALVVYRQIVEEWFSAFTRSLKTYVLMPVRVIGVVVPTVDATTFRPPSLSWYLEPLPSHATSAVDFKLGNRQDFRADNQFFSTQRAILTARRPGAQHWIHPTFYSGRLDIFDSRPITKLAYEWLKNDLKEIAWIT